MSVSQANSQEGIYTSAEGNEWFSRKQQSWDYFGLNKIRFGSLTETKSKPSHVS